MGVIDGEEILAAFAHLPLRSEEIFGRGFVADSGFGVTLRRR